jgi:hypothetical protein
MSLLERTLELLPNPFNKESTLSGLAKKSELIKESLGFVTIAKNILFLIALGVLLVAYFKISVNIVAILIGTEVLLTSIMGYIKIREFKAIYSIDTQDSARSYRKIIIANEYWEFVKSFFGVISNSISVALIFLFFSSEISNFVVQNIPPYLPIKTESLKYLVFVFVIFRSLEFIMRSVRYLWIKNLKESNDLAQVDREYTLIDKKIKLTKFLPGIGLFLLLIFLIKLPIFVQLVFAGFALLLVLLFVPLSIIELRRIKNVQFEDNAIDPSVVQHKIESYKKEQIAGAVFGTMKAATGMQDMFKPMSLSFLGVGKTYFPENTLLFTNLRLLMIQVPVAGGNKIVGEINYAEKNYFFNRGEIRQKGESIIKANNLPQILELATNDVLYKDIKTLTLKTKNLRIDIEKLNGDKLSYIFMDKEYIEHIRELSQFYLKDKFVEE